MRYTSLEELTKQSISSQFKEARLILGDQLNASHSWFQQTDDQVLYLIAELPQEATYVRHHIQKIAAFFLAMDAFSQALSKAGHQVLYLTLDHTSSFQHLPELLNSLISQHGIQRLQYQQPDEYRLFKQLEDLQLTLFDQGIESHRVSSEHFLLEHQELGTYIQPAKANRLESFYRKLRKRFNILMNNDEPEGGQWNYDQDNRNKLSKDDLSTIPQPLLFATPCNAVIERIHRHQIATLGNIDDHLLWPINRVQAKELLEYFCQHLLPNFGRFQDAMTCQSDYQWSLYHSRLSFALNTKMISPKCVIDTAIDHFRRRPDDISIAQIEGFVRQILGWREYIRAVYWQNMPDYRHKNELNAERSLPGYFWDGKTRMNCMKHAIDQSLNFAYAHHIQRLMITGNFALLTGIHPQQVDDWYLGIYIDAIEWVELPNTRGMSQFSDGGWIASKPYAASANYIQKMGDYCNSCHYQAKLKTGNKACPFNSLYWHFMNRHRVRFEKNPRIGMIYRNWDKQSADQQGAILDQAEYVLKNIERL
jgi:deoxyribodipyrimidine photolyase-related protein